MTEADFSRAIIFTIYAISSSISFMIVCIGVSYLRCTQYYKYDSKDFVDDEEKEENEE